MTRSPKKRKKKRNFVFCLSLFMTRPWSKANNTRTTAWLLPTVVFSWERKKDERVWKRGLHNRGTGMESSFSSSSFLYISLYDTQMIGWERKGQRADEALGILLLYNHPMTSRLIWMRWYVKKATTQSMAPSRSFVSHPNALGCSLFFWFIFCSWWADLLDKHFPLSAAIALERLETFSLMFSPLVVKKGNSEHRHDRNWKAAEEILRSK